MQCVYRLLHIYSTRKTKDGESLLHVIELGYFSKKDKAKNIIKKYKSLKGFKDYNVKCFKIKKFYINLKNNEKRLYELYHSYIDEKGYEEFNFLGVYPSKEHAINKQKRLLKTKKQYKLHPTGFDISEEILDSENSIWNQGFDQFD